MCRIHNCKLNVTVKGEGQGILLLHGWGQNAYMMKFLQDHLCEHYKVVNLDLPGFGESEEPDHAWDLNEYASAMHELCDYYEINQPIIIAHSFGARIAFHYALQYPLQAMILTGAAGIRKKHGISYYIRVYSYKFMKKWHRQIQMGSVDYQQASDIMRSVLVKSVNDDITPELAKIKVETLLVWGEQDEQTPLWMGKMMETLMPHATLVTLAKDDHFAYFHQSLRFKAIVDAFLEGIS